MAERRRPQDRARESVTEALGLLRDPERRNDRRAMILLERAESDLAGVEDVAGGVWVIFHFETHSFLRDRDALRVRGIYTSRDEAKRSLPVERWLNAGRVVEEEHKACCRMQPWLVRDVAPFLGPAPAVNLHEHTWDDAEMPDGKVIRVCRFPNCFTIEPAAVT